MIANVYCARVFTNTLHPLHQVLALLPPSPPLYFLPLLYRCSSLKHGGVEALKKKIMPESSAIQKEYDVFYILFCSF